METRGKRKQEQRTQNKGKKKKLIDVRYASSAKSDITSKITSSIVGTLQMKTSALHEPLNLECNPSIHKVMKVAVDVLQRECIWINEIFGDLKMKLRWQVHKGGAG